MALGCDQTAVAARATMTDGLSRSGNVWTGTVTAGAGDTRTPRFGNVYVYAVARSCRTGSDTTVRGTAAGKTGRLARFPLA